MIIVAGLGNPGSSYADTRHNVGFRVVDRLSNEYGIKCKKKGFDSLWGRGRIDGFDVVLAKPQTFMNLSGRAISALKAYFDLDTKDILVVCDDCELPFGKIRLRRNGGAGSHNGLKSVISSLGCKDFPRMRLGVGSPPDFMELSDYVLAPFTKQESAKGAILEEMLSNATAATLAFITRDIEYAMNEFNPL